MVHPYSGIDPENYGIFCSEINKCKGNLYDRPQIAKQHFTIAMNSLHKMEVEEPEMTPVIQEIGKEIESKLIEQHKAYGLYIFPRY